MNEREAKADYAAREYQTLRELSGAAQLRSAEPERQSDAWLRALEGTAERLELAWRQLVERLGPVLPQVNDGPTTRALDKPRCLGGSRLAFGLSSVRDRLASLADGMEVVRQHVEL